MRRRRVGWYRKAAEQGDAIAQFNLGLMYCKGEGVEEDGREGYIWFSIATRGGHERVGIALREISSQLTAEEIQSAKQEAKRRFDEIENRKNNGEAKNSVEK